MFGLLFVLQREADTRKHIAPTWNTTDDVAINEFDEVIASVITE